MTGSKNSNVKISIGEALDELSVSELEERITALEEELTRVRDEIVNKKLKMSDAESVFKP